MNSVTAEVRSLTREHPLKKTFHSLGIRLVDIAAVCNVSTSSAAHWMAGYRRPSAAQESKLQALAARAMRELKAQDQGEAARNE